MTRNRDLVAMTAGGHAVPRPLLLRFVIAVVLVVGIVPWGTLATVAQDSTPTAGAAQVVAEIPNITVAGKTGGTLNMGINADALNFDPAQTQDNMPLWIDGRRVVPDFRWPAERLIVEADSRTWHENPTARADDAERQALLEAHGERVLLVTWAQAVARPTETIRRIAAAGAPASNGTR